MVKLKAPEGFGNVSVDGQEYITDKSGCIEVPENAVASLKPFGFNVFIPEEKKTAKKSDK